MYKSDNYAKRRILRYCLFLENSRDISMVAHVIEQERGGTI